MDLQRQRKTKAAVTDSFRWDELCDLRIYGFCSSQLYSFAWIFNIVFLLLFFSFLPMYYGNSSAVLYVFPMFFFYNVCSIRWLSCSSFISHFFSSSKNMPIPSLGARLVKKAIREEFCAFMKKRNSLGCLPVHQMGTALVHPTSRKISGASKVETHEKTILIGLI